MAVLSCGQSLSMREDRARAILVLRCWLVREAVQGQSAGVRWSTQ